MVATRFKNNWAKILVVITLLALDHQTQELVVIKLLTFGEDFEWRSLKLFEREAEVLKSLDHPAIPCYLDYFEVERGFALVQSYINARSLEEHIRTGRTFNPFTQLEYAFIK